MELLGGALAVEVSVVAEAAAGVSAPSWPAALTGSVAVLPPSVASVASGFVLVFASVATLDPLCASSVVAPALSLGDTVVAVVAESRGSLM